MDLVLLPLEPAEEAVDAVVVAAVPFDRRSASRRRSRSAHGTSSRTALLAPPASARRAARGSAACSTARSRPAGSTCVGSGTTRSMSSSMMLPKPWQVGQAPNGLLNENSRGCGSSYGMPQVAALEALARTGGRPVAAGLVELRSRTPRRRLRGTRSRSSRSAATRSVAVDLEAIDDDLQHRPIPQRRRIDVVEVDASGRRRSRRPKPLRRSAASVAATESHQVAAAPAAAPRASSLGRRRPSASSSSARARADAIGAERDDRHVEADQQPGALRQRAQPRGHDLGRLADHFLAALAAERPADAGVEQPHVVVDLGGRADRRPRIADAVLLADGDRRGRCLRSESTSGFSIRSRNCRA